MDQPYIDALQGIQDHLVVSIQTVRRMIQHGGEIGGRVEDLIRDALAVLLPAKIGVSTGFVVDSEGRMSEQMDIILYDRLNAPQVPLPEGAYPKGTKIFPVEATYACGEIKTVLDSARLDDCISKRDSYKSLRRGAYLSESSSVITQTYYLYGEKSTDWQSLFFCLAVESVDMSVLCEKLKRDAIERNLPPNRQMDGVFSLDTSSGKKNCAIFAKPASTWVADSELQEAELESVSLLAEPDHRLSSYRAHSPLALFIVQIMRYLQADLRPMSVLPYWQGSF